METAAQEALAAALVASTRDAAALAAALAREEVESQLAATVSEATELIFLLVPLDSRLRCREVARSWRALLERRWLWRDSTCRPFLLRCAPQRCCAPPRLAQVASCAR